jgi:hypothetical protein
MPRVDPSANGGCHREVAAAAPDSARPSAVMSVAGSSFGKPSIIDVFVKGARAVSVQLLVSGVDGYYQMAGSPTHAYAVISWPVLGARTLTARVRLTNGRTLHATSTGHRHATSVGWLPTGVRVSEGHAADARAYGGDRARGARGSVLVRRTDGRSGSKVLQRR